MLTFITFKHIVTYRMCYMYKLHIKLVKQQRTMPR